MALFNKSHRAVRRIWAKSQRFFLRYGIDMVGEFDQSAQLIIINHQSMLDIIVLEELHPGNLCWLTKKEINDLPIIGQIVKVPKMISVDRKNPRDLVRIINESKDRIADGRVLAMFPEGTRSQNGDMLKFQSGAKIIASKLNLKVQPIVLIGTGNIINSKEFKVRKGVVKIVCLDLVDTSNINWLEYTRDLMQKTIEQARAV